MRRVAIAALLFTTALQAQRPGTPTRPPALTRSETIAAAREVMKAARYATFVTIGPNGQPQARIVDPGVPDSNLTIWVATNPLTRKVAEIRRNPRVTLLYFNAAAGEYVTVLGRATVVRDSTERARHWHREWAPHYSGPHGADFLLLRIKPSRLEVVSARQGVRSDEKTWRPVMIELP